MRCRLCVELLTSVLNAAGIKEASEESDDKGQSKPGLLGALMGRSAEKEDDNSQSSSGKGTSMESSLSQIGASVTGAESAERESRPVMPAGMGPSSGSNSLTSIPVRTTGSMETSPNQGAGQRSPAVRSMILEKPPSFKVGSPPHISFRIVLVN